MLKPLASLLLLLVLAAGAEPARAADRKIVLIAGKPSHFRGEHEHNAGMLLFKKCLESVPGIRVETHSGGWPTNDSAFAGAAAVVFYCDGGAGHPALQGDHLQQLAAVRAQGAGFACLHYAVEPTRNKGQQEFLSWIGGCFETDWSVNPFWEADFKALPEHPITRGVRPFKIVDEWYFHMRFPDGMKGVTPILSAVAPLDTLERPDGPHSGNPHVRRAVTAGEPQHVAWAYESPEGFRGFGFTGGHRHKNWADDNLRKIVLNAILWVAGVEVPANGVDSVVSALDIAQNLDPKGRQKTAPAPAAPAAK